MSAPADQTVSLSRRLIPQLHIATTDLAIKVINGETVAGVSGVAVTNPEDCSDAGEINCVTTSFYRSTKLFRNTARSVTTTIRYDNITTPGVLGLDVYDTIDDYQNNIAGLPPDQPWGPNYAANASYWEDITRYPNGDPASCAIGLACIKQDKITGLMWSKENTLMDFSDVPAGNWPCGGAGCTETNGNVSSGGGSGTYANGANMSWWDAIFGCHLLNNRQYGGYNTGWRLPTQKEMMQAHIHGIRSVANSNWISGTSTDLWSSTTNSHTESFAWNVNFAIGNTYSSSKLTLNGFVCVR